MKTIRRSFSIVLVVALVALLLVAGSGMLSKGFAGAGEATESGIKPPETDVERPVYIDGFAPDDNIPGEAANAPGAVFSYKFISSIELVPRNTANAKAYSGAGCSYMASGSNPLLVGADVDLPHGSVIKFIRLYYNDTNASAGVDAALTQYSNGTSIKDLAFTGSTIAFNTGSGFAVSEEITETVNTATSSYVVYGWPDAAVGTLQFCAIRVAYYAPAFWTSFLPSISDN